jgi:hypothetical protein
MTKNELPTSLLYRIEKVWAEGAAGPVARVIEALRPFGASDRERIANWAQAELDDLDRERAS